MPVQIFKTHTGKIYVDKERCLEFLTVGDYGKENNIKADFLGLTQKINGVQHKEVDLQDKWVCTLSTQKGCQMKCAFCDCPKVGYYGNVDVYEMAYMLETIFRNEAVESTKRLNIHYARMGEPTFNDSVLDFTEYDLRHLVKRFIHADVIHPVVSTMLPKENIKLYDYLQRWCYIKNNVFDGEAGLQFSINSTDDSQREAQFRGKSASLNDISKLAYLLPSPR